MPSNFLDYEKEHNRFIRALRENKEYANMITVIREKHATILVPHDQSVTLFNGQIDIDFVQTHIIYYNPGNKLQWTSLNGVRGFFSENYDALYVLSGPPRGEEHIAFFTDPFAIFSQYKSDKKEAKKIHVLRVNEIEINGLSITMILISEPVEYEGCTWGGPSFSGNNTGISSLRTMYSSPITPNEEEQYGNSTSLRRTSSSMSMSSMSGGEAVDYGGPPINFSFKTSSENKSNKPVTTLINELISLHNISNNRLFADQQEKNMADNRNKKKFSFQDFVDKMRHKSALNLVRKIKKFICDVNKNEYTDDLPSRVITFLKDVMQEISEHSQWKNASEQEMDNAREGIEKYVMTKIYSKVFSPTLDDLQQDNILATRLSSFRKLRPEHLDINPRIFLDPSCNHAVDELKKMNNYKTPRDKMICISNCCKIIFNVLTRVNPEEAPSADLFLPVLIYLVMRANPPHLHSNLKYIMEYRNPEKMISEAGYFFTNLQSSVVFWTDVDHTSLSIEKHEFEKLMNGQYFNDEDEEIESPRLNSQFGNDNNKSKDYGSSSSSDGEEEESITILNPELQSEFDSDIGISTPLSTSQEKNIQDLQTNSIELDTKSSGVLAPEETTSFPMTPLSRSEQRMEDKKTSPESATQPSEQKLYEFVQNAVQKDQLSSIFLETNSVNDLRVGDLDKLLTEYKQLHHFYVTIQQLVIATPPRAATVE